MKFFLSRILRTELPSRLVVRESTPSRVQSTLAFLCVGVRYAEESPRPSTNILADRNGLAHIVDCWVGSRAY